MNKKCPICGKKLTGDGQNHPGCIRNNDTNVTCELCNETFEKMITAAHLKKHSMTVKDYREKYGVVVSKEYSAKLKSQSMLKKSTITVDVENNGITTEQSFPLSPVNIAQAADQIANAQIVERIVHEPCHEERNLTETGHCNECNTDTVVGVVLTEQMVQEMGAVALRELAARFGCRSSAKSDNIAGILQQKKRWVEH